MSAGEVAGLPAMALRRAPVQIFGSGIGGRAGLAESAAAYDSLLKMAAAGEIALDVDPVPLADIDRAWAHPDGGAVLPRNLAVVAMKDGASGATHFG